MTQSEILDRLRDIAAQARHEHGGDTETDYDVGFRDGFENGSTGVAEQLDALIEEATESWFRPELVHIERHRRSVTQGEVSVHYDGTLLGRFGDEIQMVVSSAKQAGHSVYHGVQVVASDQVEEGAVILAGWVGRGDQHWVNAARTVLRSRRAEAA